MNNRKYLAIMMNLKSFMLAALAVIVVACTPGNEPVNPASRMHKSPKRGVAFNFTSLMDLPLLSDAISWDYNWGNSALDDAAMWFDANGIEYCPMCWSGSYSKDKIRKYVAEHPSTKYLLAFNEPNLTDQANMVPSKAAELWPDVVALAKELNLKLVAPAMNYGTLAGYNDPIKWMDEFLKQPGVSIDDIDAFALHCYMANPNGLIGMVNNFKKYKKPIWMTEFCAWDGNQPGSVEGQMSYMCHVLNYFETDPDVERYAWFIPRYKKPGDFPYMQLLTNGSNPELTDLGKMFTLFSSFDKSVALEGSKFVYAGEYIELSDLATDVRVCNDPVAESMRGKEGLMISPFKKEMEVSYQVHASNAKQMVIRYSDFSECKMEVLIDGKLVDVVSMPRTGAAEKFEDAVLAVSMNGTHKVTLRLQAGSCYVSGFYFK